MTTRQQYFTAMLAQQRIGLGAMNGLLAQAAEENTAAHWNPLATTEPWPGGTDFNSVGVKSYSSEGSGIAATWATLTNGRYPEALDAIKRGNATEYVVGIANSPWGTWDANPGAALATLDIVEAHPVSYANILVPGTVPAPPPGPPQRPKDVTVQVAQVGPGSVGGDVVTVQSVLNTKHNSGLATDGIYGPHVHTAVESFQQAHNLVVDGIVGPQTWPALING
jgi:Putative peptidoglycan binding domain